MSLSRRHASGTPTTMLGNALSPSRHGSRASKRGGSRNVPWDVTARVNAGLRSRARKRVESRKSEAAVPLCSSR